jgi:hypothetical protein
LAPHWGFNFYRYDENRNESRAILMILLCLIISSAIWVLLNYQLREEVIYGLTCRRPLSFNRLTSFSLQLLGLLSFLFSLVLPLARITSDH